MPSAAMAFDWIDGSIAVARLVLSMERVLVESTPIVM